MKTIILIFILMTSIQSFAREIQLATITGNVDTDTSYFLIEVDENNDLDTVRFKTVTRGGQVTQDNFFPAETVDVEGVVLLRRNGRNILRLETVKPFSFSTGGQVKLSYLYSGVNNSWKSLNVKLIRPGDNFEIQTLNGAKVSQFFVKGNFHPIFGLVGILDLVPRP